MDKETLDQLIANANKHEPLDLTDVHEARFVRDLDVPSIVLLWHSGRDPERVQHWFAKYPPELAIAPDMIICRGVAFWIVQPEGGFKIMSTPNGPMTEEFIQNARPDGKMEVLGPTHCADCKMKTGIRGEWYLVHDHVWEQAWSNSKTTNSTEFFCDELLCVGCLEKRLDRQLTPADFPPGWDGPNTYMSKRLRNRAYASRKRTLRG
jgi:hypothetical protein